MNGERVSRNDPCPCGSGLKFKKCCYRKAPAITHLDRTMAIEVLEEYVETCNESEDARDAFYADLDIDVPVMTEHFRDVSESAFLFWFAFDRQLEDGSGVLQSWG